MIPRFEQQVRFISNALEEKEREEKEKREEARREKEEKKAKPARAKQQASDGNPAE